MGSRSSQAQGREQRTFKSKKKVKEKVASLTAEIAVRKCERLHDHHDLDVSGAICTPDSSGWSRVGPQRGRGGVVAHAKLPLRVKLYGDDVGWRGLPAPCRGAASRSSCPSTRLGVGR